MDKTQKTLQERLAERKTKDPGLAYTILGNIWRIFILSKLNVHYEYKVNPKDYKDQAFFVVSNHTSRLDYMYSGRAFLPLRLNYVAGYNEFFRSHLAFVFRLLQVIPKRNFTNDMHAFKEISRIIRKGGKVIIWPEGMASIAGGSQPCAPGSGQLLKHFKVPVFMTKIEGGYLTNTKYCLDQRIGRVNVTVDLLFKPEDLERMSAEEIQAKLDETLSHDVYEWNKTARVKVQGKGRMAQDMHQFLYYCPKCGSEFTMRGAGDKLRCLKCGNGAKLNEYYDFEPFNKNCVIPESPRAWWDLQRKTVYHQIQEEGFELSEWVRLGTIPKDHTLKNLAVSEVIGEGDLRLSRKGLDFKGTRDGAAFEFHIDSEYLQTLILVTDMSSFQTYYKGEFLEFLMESESVPKWVLAAEEIHRINGGIWKNFPDATTYD